VATHQSRTGSEPPLAATAIAHVGAAVDAHSEGRDATVLASALARPVPR
jgi:hypothetical protein